MASENETVADIVKEMRQVGPYPIYKKPIFANPKSISESYAKRFMYGHFVTDFGTVVIENPKVKDVSNYELASRIEAAHKREVAELKKKCEEYERQPELMAETATAALELLKAQESKIAELREYLKANTVGVKAMHEEIETLRGMITDLRAKLKVAEDALAKLQDRFVSSVHDGTIDPYEALKIAEDALAAIREEGGAS